MEINARIKTCHPLSDLHQLGHFLPTDNNTTMNSFRSTIVLLVVCAAVVSAEPPRFRSNRFQSFQRQEQEQAGSSGADDGSGDAPYPPAVSAPYPPAMPPAAPYPPSNWKPSGRLFALPARQTQPREAYGPPALPTTTQEPTAEVEPEDVTTEQSGEDETTEQAPTTEPLSENVDVGDNAEQKSQRLSQPASSGGPGFYYVQLPQLQQQQQSQQLVSYQVNQVQQSAPLRQLPVVAATAAVAPQPLVYTSQPFVVSGYYVQNW